MAKFNIHDVTSVDDLKLLRDQEVSSHAWRRFEESKDTVKMFWNDHEENQRFVAGPGQWKDADLSERKNAKKPAYVLNDIIAVINSWASKERANRTGATFIGREGDDHWIADIFKEVIRHIKQYGRMEYSEADAFRDLHIDRISFVEYDHDMTKGQFGLGQTVCENVPLHEVMWQTSCRARNLQDRSWCARGQFYEYDNFIGKFPDQEGKSRELLFSAIKNRSKWTTLAEEKTHRWPWLYTSEGRYIRNPSKANEIFVIDYQWKQLVQKIVVVAPKELMSEAEIEESLKANVGPSPRPVMRILDSESDLSDFRDEYGSKFGVSYPSELITRVPRWLFKRAYLVGDNVILEEDHPYGAFSRVAMTSYPLTLESATEYFCATDLMKDPQRFRNYIFSLGTTILQHAPKGGWAYEQGAFVNSQAAKRQLAMPGGMAELRRGGAKKIHNFPQPQFPSGLQWFMEAAQSAVRDPVAASDASLNQANNLSRVPGKTFNAFQAGVMEIMAHSLDALSLFRIESTELLFKIVSNADIYDEHDIINIVGEQKVFETVVDEEGNENVVNHLPPKSEWSESLYLNVIPEEVEASASERFESWSTMTQHGIMQELLAKGDIPMSLFIDMIPGFSKAQKREWLDHHKARDAQAARIAELEQMIAEMQGTSEQGFN